MASCGAHGGPHIPHIGPLARASPPDGGEQALQVRQLRGHMDGPDNRGAFFLLGGVGLYWREHKMIGRIDAELSYGDELAKAGRYDEAMKRYDRRHPRRPPCGAPLLGRAGKDLPRRGIRGPLAEQGVRLLKMGRYSEALPLPGPGPGRQHPRTRPAG